MDLLLATGMEVPGSEDVARPQSILTINLMQRLCLKSRRKKISSLLSLSPPTYMIDLQVTHSEIFFST